MKYKKEMFGDELYEYIPLSDNIVKAKGVCGGRPTFKYTRIEAKGVLALVKAGEPVSAIVKHFRDRVSESSIHEAIELFGL